MYRIATPLCTGFSAFPILWASITVTQFMVSRKSVMVVDDFEPWRAFVASELQNESEVQVVCEVADGLKAVESSARVQPDLILLDIGIPTLNGIEAARQIRVRAPMSKILFVTQESSIDLVTEALRLGAWGYLVKSDAESELLPAVKALLQGRRYLSARVADHDLIDSTECCRFPSTE
jgi:DNA-binding NarL/FixJ family response regulator